MIEIRQTETYSRWFSSLRDRQARARIDIRIRRLSMGNPEFATVLKVIQALGLRLLATPVA